MGILHWIWAMFFEAFACLAILILHPARYLKREQMGLGPKTGRPILLIHGYLHDSSAWLYHRRKLIQAGLGPIYTISLGNPFLSIEKYAEKVRRKVEQIEKETKRSDLILIGHSMGGLVSLFYAAHLAPTGTVTDLITIGSPLAGTHVAKIGLGADARQMERNSSFIQNLQRDLLMLKDCRFYNIATKTDQLVIPYTSSLFGNRPAMQVTYEDIGHVALLFSPRVSKQLIQWLVH